MSERISEEALQKYVDREQPDEARRRARRRRGCVMGTLAGVALAGAFCCFITLLVGVPQSFLGQWWMKPPRYPNAVEVDFREGEVCQMQSPGVYCYEWFYRTLDAEQEIIDYYQRLEWPMHARITFEWRKGRRFDTAWVAESCIAILSNMSCYQIIVRPADEGNTEVYILERGAMGDIWEGSK